MGISCRISKGPAGQVTAYNKDGSASQLFRQLEDYYQDTDRALQAWAMTESEDFQVEYPKGSVQVEDVLKYIDTVASDGVQLSKEEVRELSSVMESYGYSKLSELNSDLVKIFKPDGLITFDADLALEKGLYTEDNIKEINLDEISELLIKIEGQLRLYDIEVSEVDNVVTDTSRKTAIGNHPKVTIDKVEEDMRNLLTEHANDEATFLDKVSELPYVDIAEKLLNNTKYRNKVMDKYSNLTVVPQVTLEGDTISNETSQTLVTVRNTVPVDTDTLPLEAKLRYLEETSPLGWGNTKTMQKVLRGIVDKFVDYNVDIVGLDTLVNRPSDTMRLVRAAIDMLESPSQTSFKNFAEIKQELLPEESAKRIEELPERYKGYNIVSLYTAKSDQELFDRGLIKVGEDLYHRVGLESKSALYEYIYEMYVQGRIDIPQNLKSVEDINDIASKVQVLQDIEKFIGSRETGLDVKDNELLSLYQVAFEHAPITKQNPTSRLSKATSVQEEVMYLPTDFISDFYNYQLREKAKDSVIYRDVLSKFAITDKDITLTGNVKSIEGIELQRDLEDYIRLRKDNTMDHLLLEQRGNFVNADLVAVNFPGTVREHVGEAIKEGEFAVVPQTNINFIKVDGEVYRKLFDRGNKSIYKSTPVNNSPLYFQTEVDYKYDLERAVDVIDRANILPETMTRENFEKQLAKAKFQNRTSLPVQQQEVVAPKTPREVVDAIQQKLSQTGLATSITTLTPTQLKEKLEESGAYKDVSLKESLNEAKRLLSTSSTKSEVLDKTGWFFEEGSWRHFSPSTLENIDIKPEIDKSPGKSYDLSEVIGDENVIFKYYPMLKTIKVDFYEGREGEFAKDREGKRIMVNTNRSAEIFRDGKYLGGVVGNVGGITVEESYRMSLVHELQHNIQRREGWPRGGSPSTVITEAIKKIGIKVTTFKEALTVLGDHVNKGTTDPLILKAYNVLNQGNEELFRTYLLLYGEVEARTIELAMLNTIKGLDIKDVSFEALRENLLSAEGLDVSDILPVPISDKVDYSTSNVPIFNEDLLLEVSQILDSKIKIIDLYDESQQEEINRRVEDCRG
jgi:hypothetical protein